MNSTESAVSKSKGSWRTAMIGWIAAVVIAFTVTAGIVMARENRIVSQQANLQQVNARGERVLVMQVQAPAQNRTIELPGTIRGYVETPIYAKTPGYLKTIYVDKGDRVHKGEVMAVLESPELDKEVADARASYWLAQVTDQRYQYLVREGVVAQQTADNSHAAMLQAQALYQQLLAMQGYETVRAQTDGIITNRFVDPGALIPAVTTPGASTTTPIVVLATMRPLRVYADVPQDLSDSIHDGDPAAITVTQYPQRTFEGTVTRHPTALYSFTRTMRVEVDLPNDDLSLYPGMYTTVTLTVSQTDQVPRVPDDALVFRSGKVYVPLVRDNHLHLASVTLGWDSGTEAEITRGVSPGDMVAVNVGQGAEDGEPVQPVEMISR